MAAFNHPNICHIHDVGPNYIVMEFIDGVPLTGPLPVEKAVGYAGFILDALDAAHRKGFTHRDLKPANVMLPKQGGLKLLDFGLAKQSAFGLGPDDVTGAALTVKGQISAPCNTCRRSSCRRKKPMHAAISSPSDACCTKC